MASEIMLTDPTYKPAASLLITSRVLLATETNAAIVRSSFTGTSSMIAIQAPKGVNCKTLFTGLRPPVKKKRDLEQSRDVKTAAHNEPSAERLTQ